MEKLIFAIYKTIFILVKINLFCNFPQFFVKYSHAFDP